MLIAEFTILKRAVRGHVVVVVLVRRKIEELYMLYLRHQDMPQSGSEAIRSDA